ncbi:MAG: multidrug MFS transporter [Clostridiales bacterium]|nr:multidrug MFS transporter [Clostridiales bacterium]
MIFVTVGTHEQQFDRLVEYMDGWAERHDEEVVIQTGFSHYKPRKANWKSIYPYRVMVEMIDSARIIITHGGPSSFILPLQIGKIPIVVPRNQRFKEHVNNHQIDFCREYKQRRDNIIVVENVNRLEETLESYDTIVGSMKRELKSNNEWFCKELEKLIDELVGLEK